MRLMGGILQIVVTMRVLIVNNGVRYPTKIAALFATDLVEVVPFSLVPARYRVADHDLIVLTGSNQRPIPYFHHEIAPLLQWITLQQQPLLGICYGAELIAEAYGGTLHHLGPERKYKGFYTINTRGNAFGLPDRLCVYESHQWIIESVLPPLSPVIKTTHGVLLFRHTERPHIGVMFHPEKYHTETDGLVAFEAILRHFNLL